MFVYYFIRSFIYVFFPLIHTRAAIRRSLCVCTVRHAKYPQHNTTAAVTALRKLACMACDTYANTQTQHTYKRPCAFQGSNKEETEMLAELLANQITARAYLHEFAALCTVIDICYTSQARTQPAHAALLFCLSEVVSRLRQMATRFPRSREQPTRRPAAASRPPPPFKWGKSACARDVWPVLKGLWHRVLDRTPPHN